MSHPEKAPRIPANYPVQTSNDDYRQPLLNLSAVKVRMDSLQRFITESIHNNRLISTDQMNMVSSEIVSAIQQTIVNGTALLTYSQQHHTGEVSEPVNQTATTSHQVNGKNSDMISEVDELMMTSVTNPKIEGEDEEIDGDDEEDCEIIELDAVELLAEHVHFCDMCGKGFKRDANLRMHMRAHGNQFKTMEALAKPEKVEEIGKKVRKTRFSCPFQGCNRNRTHNKFKALKSIICVRNHFKRSHCPKMYSCNRCNKKSFSVLADLKSHLKHCGEVKWKCSCGTSFSRKDKLFGHITLFEGHMPAVVIDNDENQKTAVSPLQEAEETNRNGFAKLGECSGNNSNDAFFDGLLDGFVAMEGYCLQDMLASSPGFNAGNW